MVGVVGNLVVVCGSIYCACVCLMIGNEQCGLGPGAWRLDALATQHGDDGGDDGGGEKHGAHGVRCVGR